MNLNGACKFLEIRNLGEKDVAAHCYCYVTKTEIRLNHRLFDNIPEGSLFSFDMDYVSIGNYVCIIKEEDIPIILEKMEAAAKARHIEYERIKAENIATGRFTYSYSDYRGGQAETIIEKLSDNYDEFWQAVADRINEELCNEFGDRKNDKRLTELIELAQVGDQLEWYSWYGGPMAALAGPQLRRNDQIIAFYPIFVS